MTGRTYKFDKRWALAAVAIVAFFWPMVMPHQFTMHSSGRLVVWPALALSGGLFALWVGVWISSLKLKSIPAPLLLVTFLMTAYPLYVVAQSWECLTGECSW